MGVFKRQRINKEGKQASYWYIIYSLKGKMKWESVGKVGEVTKDVARYSIAPFLNISDTSIFISHLSSLSIE